MKVNGWDVDIRTTLMLYMCMNTVVSKCSLSLCFIKLSHIFQALYSTELERIEGRNSPVGLTLAVTLVTLFNSVGSGIYIQVEQTL